MSGHTLVMKWTNSIDVLIYNNKINMTYLEDYGLIFLTIFHCFRFVQLLFTHRSVPLSLIMRSKNDVRVFSIAVERIVLEFGSFRETRNPR